MTLIVCPFILVCVTYTLIVVVPVGAIFTSSVYMNASTTGALFVAAGANRTDILAVERAAA